MGPGFVRVRRLLGNVLPGRREGVVDGLARVVVGAGVERSSLFDAAGALGLPVRSLSRAVSGLDEAGVSRELNEALWGLAKPHLPCRFDVCVDLTDIPYHGSPMLDDGELVRSQPVQGTTWKHRYVTAYVTHDRARFTLCVYYVRNGVKAWECIAKVVQRLRELGVVSRVRSLLADKGFYSTLTFRVLKQAGIPFIVPVPVRATRIKDLCDRETGTREWYHVGHAYVDQERVRLVTTRVVDRGSRPDATFAYATHRINQSGPRIHQRYLTRGGIETSYKLANKARARTTTRNPITRLLYFGVAMILQNAWVATKRVKQATTWRQYLRHERSATHHHAPPNQPEPG